MKIGDSFYYFGQMYVITTLYENNEARALCWDDKENVILIKLDSKDINLVASVPEAV